MHKDLSIRNLSVDFLGKKILQDISFSAMQGEFIGIIGPNGAGKSTLLRSIRGLLPSTGEVKVFGKNLQQFSDKSAARQIAYMQQNVNLEFGFTALEIVLAGRYPYLKWWQNECKQDKEIALQYMKFTGVDHLAQQTVQLLSGGERQRVLLAKVLAQETRLVFLDEPTASLDLMYQEEIFRYCQRICRETDEKKLVLMVVHDIKMAAKFCSRLLLISRGEVIADGKPEDVITAENLDQAYGLQAAVFTNPISGALDLHTYQRQVVRTASKEMVYIIGGGNQATEWIRCLFEYGKYLVGGIFCEGEVDAQAAKIFDVDCNFIASADQLTEATRQSAQDRQIKATWTLLANIIYTHNNIWELEQAKLAKRLLVIEDEPIEQRDFSGGQAIFIYKQLVRQKNVVVVTTNELRQCYLNKQWPFSNYEVTGEGK